MLSKVNFKRDSAGIGVFLKSAGVSQAINGKARTVASQVGGTVKMETTDRARATVSVARENFHALTIRDGGLIRAAYNANLEFRAYQ